MNTVTAADLTTLAMLNKLTAAVTAFRCWEDFRASMANDGYIPTMNGRGQMGRLAKLVAAQGFTIYRDGRLIRPAK